MNAAEHDSESREAADSGFVTMARIGAPYGIKGWFKLHSYTQPMENVLDYRHFRLRLATRPGAGKLSGEQGASAGKNRLDGTEIEIDEVRPHGKTLVAHISGRDTPEAVRELAGAELMVAAALLPDLDSGEFYWHQLTGLQVLTRDGRCLGHIVRMLETGANDVVVVAASEQSIDERQRLLPYLPGQVVLSVDLDNAVMMVEWDPDW